MEPRRVFWGITRIQLVWAAGGEELRVLTTQEQDLITAFEALRELLPSARLQRRKGPPHVDGVVRADIHKLGEGPSQSGGGWPRSFASLAGNPTPSTTKFCSFGR